MRRAELASTIDHTVLDPTATDADVAVLCREAVELGVFAVCISPSRLPVPRDVLGPDRRVAVVVGFPSGAHRPEVKAAEAEAAVAAGADEVDMVIDLGLAAAADWAGVEAGIAAVRAAVPRPTLVKVIIESALLDDRGIVAACRAAEEAGADFVKTSTGFSPAGGATTQAVALMRRSVGDRLGVKASGGIRTAERAVAMIEAGATRIGCSSSRAVLDGLA